jgi:hypothetical protein
MKALFILLILLTGQSVEDRMDNGENTRYIIIEAPCKTGFNALPDYQEKVILTKVFKMTFENSAELINAEPELISNFELALENAYPNSRNQVKDILVYMITTEKEAKALYKRKVEQFKILKTGIIDLKLP